MTIPHARHLLRSLIAIGLLPFAAGCLVTAQIPTAAPIEQRTLRDTGAKAFVYVPSRYEGDRAWPLVVLCHGTSADSAWLEMREWAQYAEDHGFIVIAPELVGTRARPPKPPEQINRQRRDERTILAAVASVRASNRIAEEKIFLTGWSSGNYAVLWTGLRNPDTFRALSLRQSPFDARFFGDTGRRVDRWQPIFVCYGAMDSTRESSEQAMGWLLERGMFVKDFLQPSAYNRVPIEHTWDFFKDVFENRPWIRVKAVCPDPRNPRNVHFSIKAVPTAVAVEWNFGDGHTADAAALSHLYEKNGTYEVSTKVKLSNGKTYRRMIAIQIPRGGDGLRNAPRTPGD